MSRINITAFFLLIAGWNISVGAQITESPAASDRQLARVCRQLLEESLLDFYLPDCLDQKHGGYYEILNEAGQFVESEKFLTLQARQVWFFSTLAIENIRRQEALAAAKSGYEFLRNHFYDKKNGGYYAKVSANGLQQTDERKHVYHNAFVIYALVE